jgi:hypothetical protein
MNKILKSLSILGVALALSYAFGMSAQAGQISVERDLGSFTMSDVNQFGDDRAYSSPTKGTDRDADSQYFRWTPDSYGLKGTYGYFSNGAG